MDRLSYADMNSLNAIAGFLRCRGYHGIAETLFSIQCKATRLLEEVDNGIPQNSKRN